MWGGKEGPRDQVCDIEMVEHNESAGAPNTSVSARPGLCAEGWVTGCVRAEHATAVPPSFLFLLFFTLGSSGD